MWYIWLARWPIDRAHTESLKHLNILSIKLDQPMADSDCSAWSTGSPEHRRSLGRLHLPNRIFRGNYFNDLSDYLLTINCLLISYGYSLVIKQWNGCIKFATWIKNSLVRQLGWKLTGLWKNLNFMFQKVQKVYFDSKNFKTFNENPFMQESLTRNQLSCSSGKQSAFGWSDHSNWMMAELY